MISKIPGYDYSDDCHIDYSNIIHDTIIYKEVTTIHVSIPTKKKTPSEDISTNSENSEK